jgi:N-acyl amino acid synthase of PEP-CTERM/exosortase system
MPETTYFDFRRLDDPAELAESYRLRWQVYCQERGFLPAADYPDGLETDRHDARAVVFGAFARRDGAMVGTVRLVRSPDLDLPLFEHCAIERQRLPAGLDPARCGEISRLAVSKSYRRRAGDGLYGLADPIDDASSPNPDGRPRRRNRPEIVLGLYKTLYQESRRSGIDYWFAAMEESLSRLLARFAFRFQTAGPETDYYGPVTPSFCCVREMEEMVCRRCPALAEELSAGLDPELLPPALRAPSVSAAVPAEQRPPWQRLVG